MTTRNFINVAPRKMSNKAYIEDCDNILNHHFNDDYQLFVSVLYNGQDPIGIKVLSRTDDDIYGFVRNYLKNGWLKEQI